MLYEYFKRMKVFAAVDDLPKDSGARKIAHWAACEVLEDFYGLEADTAASRRASKLLSSHLPLTCCTPEWMQKWIADEPELFDDCRKDRKRHFTRLKLPMGVSAMFAEFAPTKRQHT